MPRLPRISSRQMVRVLEALGFYLERQVGSHMKFEHPDRISGSVTVTYGYDVLHPKTLKSILSQGSITLAELIALL